MVFSLVFLLKIGRLHFSDYLRKRPGPLLLILLFAIYMSRQATYVKKNQKFENFNLRETSLLKAPPATI